MSRNQKAPLLAFALVALVCGLVVVDTMRGEAEPHPPVVLSPAQLGPAYFLAPEPEPISPSDQAEPSPEASGPPDLAESAASATPGSADEGQSADSQAADPARHDDGHQVHGSPSDDQAPPAETDDAAKAGELWPPSSVPGIKTPIVVAFTIVDPSDLRPGNGPDDEPSQQPSQEPSHSPSAGADQNGPRDPGQSEDTQQPDPASEPSGAAPSAAP